MAGSQRSKEIKRRRHRKEQARKARIREAMKLKGTKKPAAPKKKKEAASPAPAPSGA
ncbi:MAG: hypothetical protein U0527_08710 [Candidatus Eisenbacteria bacterium]